VIETIKLVLLFNPLRLFLPFSLFCLIAGFGWGIPFLILGHGVSVGAVLTIVTGLLFFTIGLIANQSASIRMGLLTKE